MIPVYDLAGVLIEGWADDEIDPATGLPGVYYDYVTGIARPYSDDERRAAADRLAAAAAAAAAAQALTAAADLDDRLTADIGQPGDVWPTSGAYTGASWHALAALKASDVTTIAALWRVVRWMIPAGLRTARAARRALRQINQLREDTP